MAFTICVVGCGAIANKVHGPSYRKYAGLNNDVTLAACCDLDEHKAMSFQRRFGFNRYYSDMSLMLEAEKPDAVCLISPVKLTAELSVKIMEKGYPLILEKPPGMNHKETMRIIEIAKRKDVPHQVAFNRRFMPVVEELNKQISKCLEPNEIQNIRYDLFRVDRRDSDFAETAVHGIDTAKYIARSAYKHISFHYQELSSFGTGVANIHLECTFESGALAQLSFCPVTGITIERITVSAYDNTFFAELPVWNSIDSPGRVLHFEKNRQVAEVYGTDISEGTELFETNGFYNENAAFFDSIRNGNKISADVSTALQSVEIADCIRKRKSEYRQYK